MPYFFSFVISNVTVVQEYQHNPVYEQDNGYSNNYEAQVIKDIKKLFYCALRQKNTERKQMQKILCKILYLIIL